jgi:hypothetical protein
VDPQALVGVAEWDAFQPIGEVQESGAAGFGGDVVRLLATTTVTAHRGLDEEDVGAPVALLCVL